LNTVGLPWRRWRRAEAPQTLAHHLLLIGCRGSLVLICGLFGMPDQSVGIGDARAQPLGASVLLLGISGFAS
jgi:hypothetical protein